MERFWALLMKKTNGMGSLLFEGSNFSDKLSVEWDLIQGDDLVSGKPWRANIGFYTLRVPENVRTAIFKALSTTTIKTQLILEDGKVLDCHITDILNLADDGIIEVASADFRASKIQWDENAKLD